MTFASTVVALDARRANRSSCFLLTDHGVYWPLAEYFMRRNLSLSAERSYARSIARLMNWAEAKHPQFQAGGERDGALFSEFLHDLLYGTGDCIKDETGLNWKAHSPGLVRRCAGHIANFSDWLALEGKGIGANPSDRPASLFERMNACQAFRHRKAGSLMAHTMDANGDHKALAWARRVCPPGKKLSMLYAPPAFPSEKISELLWVGFENERHKDDPRPWMRWNLRDILITLLCLYGGTRVSEPMHLWIGDIFECRTDPLSCRPLIHEPESGQSVWEDPILGAQKMTRAEYLRRRCPGMLPLTRARGNRRAGWKGALLTRPERNAAEIIWIDESAGRLFKSLWTLYIENARPLAHASPWAFLTKDGLPMGPNAYADSLKRAVGKIGLPSNKATGSTPHGLRHRYGQWLNEKGISEKAGQICLRHTHLSSQNVYRQITLSQAAEEMAAASGRVSVPVAPALLMGPL